jgi:hypothetical protein
MVLKLGGEPLYDLDGHLKSGQVLDCSKSASFGAGQVSFTV